MSLKYLLECECGEKLPIEVSQAGEKIACKCGKTVAIPTLSKIRQLPVLESNADKAKPARKWSAKQGVVFVVGCVIATIGLAIAGYTGLSRQYIPTETPAADTLEAWSERIDGMDIDDTWKLWTLLRDSELHDQHPPLYAIFQTIAADLDGKIQFGLMTALVGIVIAAVSLFLRI